MMAWLVLAGVDTQGRVFSIDPIGGVSEDNMVATGAGMEAAYGVLDDRYREDLPKDDAVQLATRSLLAAISRNMTTGDGISLCVITKDGYEEYSDEEVDAVIASIKEGA
jgi:proteasome beta subunit